MLPRLCKQSSKYLFGDKLQHYQLLFKHFYYKLFLENNTDNTHRQNKNANVCEASNTLQYKQAPKVSIPNGFELT